MARHAWLQLIWTVCAALAMGGCAGASELALRGTAQSRAAEGTAELEELDDGRILVTLEMQKLPRPRQLGADLTTYLVWFLPPDGEAEKAGVLQYDDVSRSGYLVESTPMSRFGIRVTAERSPDVDRPSEHVVAERSAPEP